MRHIRSLLCVALIGLLPVLAGCEAMNSPSQAGSSVNCANQAKGRTASMPLECGSGYK